MIASWLIDQLIQQGVDTFCIAPGSRSTPLALAVANHPKAKAHVHYDERGLGFFALGIAKAQESPVAVIVTSGTAVGNLLPSAMESYHSEIPLLFLTADRPHELRKCGANQTCDQTHIFSSFVHLQMELPLDAEENAIRSIAAQAVFTHQTVHINCPFREPFSDGHPTFRGRKIEMSRGKKVAPPYATKKAKGVILVGSLSKRSEIEPILHLAKRLKWPLLADILSNARCTPIEEEIRYFDWLEKPAAEFVLHFGARMSSKKILAWLKTTAPEYVHVSSSSELQDPERILTGRVESDISSFCETFFAPFDPDWPCQWKSEEPFFEEKETFTEVHAMRQMSAILPPDFGVFFGNGMPIRDADHFFFPKKALGFFANRGLSGIDGNIATIAGLAQKMPMVGFIGDQAALYDLNSLPLVKNAPHPITLIISNNFGGGIFHHLPVATSPHFERFWGAPHAYRFEAAAQMFDLPFVSFKEIEKGFHQTRVVELITNRKENYLYQTSCSRQRC